jgi:NAD(P)-dependent dehydrogenase (short-subunit alcohol dehydrogenase family)
MAEANALPISRLGLANDSLKGQVALITGAGRGIGLEAARAFAWLGAAVVIAELSEMGQAAADMIQAEGGRALFVTADVSDPASVANLARQTVEAYGPVDILVNNAIYSPTGSVLETSLETWDRVMAVNLRGAFLTTRAFLPGMLERKRGVIINMISTDAMPHISAYIASKQGLAAFTRSVAAEVGEQGVAVVPFAPGFVDTPGLREAAQGLASHFGLTEEEFMRLPIHPAYADEPMPASHAGAATAYLAAAVAGDYHGEAVTGYTILERAGFLKSSASLAPHMPVPRPDAAGPGLGDQVGEVLRLLEKFQTALHDTEAEFNQLPVFIRPMARAGFKGKSGQSIQDWMHTSRTLRQQVDDLNREVMGSAKALRAGLPRTRELLGRLIIYYQDVPTETARFTKDAHLLAQVQQISQDRVALLHALSSELEHLLADMQD